VSPAERRILDAAKECSARLGLSKVTIDDIAGAAQVSRATLYRMFPGGKDVLFDALRVRELEEFFTQLSSRLDDATDLEDLLVRVVVYSTNELRNDSHLALMLAAEPGETLSNLTVEGLPRIIRMATLFIVPRVEPYVDRATAALLVDVLARLVISYFLAPSALVDLGEPESARRVIRSYVLPAIQTEISTTGARP
jgi:AcrR family transcriptional regulator